MNVGELKRALDKHPDNMELVEEPSIMVTEEYQHPQRGWETLAEQTDVEARIRKDFPIRERLQIIAGLY